MPAQLTSAASAALKLKSTEVIACTWDSNISLIEDCFFDAVSISTFVAIAVAAEANGGTLTSTNYKKIM